MMKRKVVIIGVSYSSRLALVRSVGVLGCDITVVAWSSSNKTIKPIDGYSKYVNRIYFCPKETNAFISLLKEKCIDPNQKVILIPDCDFSVATVDLYRKELQPYFIIPYINDSQNSIIDWMDKQKQKALAQRVGLDVVNSTLIEIKDSKFQIPQNIHYPCFPKAVASVSGGKAGMFRCDNEADLRRALQDVIDRKTVNAKVMIEDFMEIEKEYALLGFSNGKDILIPCVLQLLVISQSHKGIAAQGNVLPNTEFEEVLNKFKLFIQQIGYVGLFDIDFYLCEGKFYFSELNLRFGGSGYAVTKMGVNLPAKYVNFLNEGNVDVLETEITKEAIYVNERMCFDDLCRGFMGFREYRKYIKTSDIRFLEDPEDPCPIRAFKKEYVLTIPKIIAKKTIKQLCDRKK